jgi:hypothetical protein
LYIICSVFVAGTLAWYTLFRMRPSVWVLSAPWVVFGCAFFMIGLPSLYGPFTPPRVIIQRVSVWLYAGASSAGFLFFGLNFGDEAGAATEIWVTRACIVQGLQQIWGKCLRVVRRALLTTSIRTLVLGLHSQRSRSRLVRRAPSRHFHHLAIGCYLVRFRRLDVLGSTRILPPDPTLCPQLLQDSIPKKVGHLVLDLWYSSRLLALWSIRSKLAILVAGGRYPQVGCCRHDYRLLYRCLGCFTRCSHQYVFSLLVDGVFC